MRIYVAIGVLSIESLKGNSSTCGARRLRGIHSRELRRLLMPADSHETSFKFETVTV